MSWKIYDKTGKIVRCEVTNIEYNGEWMGNVSVTTTVNSSTPIDFDIFDYIEYRGERFQLELIPSVKKESRFEYSYDLEFVSYKQELERCQFRDLVPNDNGIVYPTPLTIEFTGTVKYLAERIQACLDDFYGKSVWTITVADDISSEEKNISISSTSCWNALSLVNTEYGLNYYITGRSITIGEEQPVVSHVFEYGKGNGLYEIERVCDNDTAVVTKLRAYGGTRNLDYSYPKQPEWEESVLPVNYILSPLRIMLPSFKLDGKTDFVLASDEIVEKYGLREAAITYDDIYPSITGATNANGERIDQIKSVTPVTSDEQATFDVYTYDLEFDLEESLTTTEAQISMKTGTLQGYTFNITNIEKQLDGGYKLTLGRNTIDQSENGNFTVPNKDLNMSTSDEFVFLGIIMPKKYIEDAENRLLERAKEYLSEYAKTKFSYNINVDSVFIKRNPSVLEDLKEGKKLVITDTAVGLEQKSITIKSLSITDGEELAPTVKITLDDNPSASTLDRIQGQISSIESNVSNNFSSNSELAAQYRRKLDKSIWDSAFVLHYDDESDKTKVTSIEALAGIWSNKYISAKGMNEGSEGGGTGGATTLGQLINVGAWADEVPSYDRVLVQLSGQTKWTEKKLSEIGGGLDERQLEQYLTTNNYAKKSDIPSLDGYATITDVDDRIDDLINGAPAAYDTLKEIADVLQGNVDSIGDILTVLGTKADKATTLAGYGITDAYTKLEVNGLLDTKLDASVFNDLFEKVKLEDGTFAIRAKYGFYTESFLSGKGLAPGEEGGGGGASNLSDLLDVNLTDLATDDMLKWDGEKWINIPMSSISVDTSKFVTIDTAQTITGEKTFNSSIILLKEKYIFGAAFETGGGMIGFVGGKTVLGSIGESTTAATHIRSKTGHATIGTSNDATYTILDTGNYSTTLDTKYVTLSTEQAITGNKNFTGSLTNNGKAVILNEGSIGANNKYGAYLGYSYATTEHGGATYGGLISAGTSSYCFQLQGSNAGDHLYFRGKSENTVSSWKEVLLSSNYSTTLDTRYIKKAGDTMTGTLTINTNGTGNYNQGIRINRTSLSNWATLTIGYAGTGTAGTSANTWLIGTPGSSNSLIFNLNDSSTSVGLCLHGHGNTDIKWNNNTVWHAGNDGSGSGLDADLLDGDHGDRYVKIQPSLLSNVNADTLTTLGVFMNQTGNGSNNQNIPESYGVLLNFPSQYNNINYRLQIHASSGGTLSYRIKYDSGNSFTWANIARTTDNVASATKLQTARTIWGQSFDGTKNVSGALTGVTSITASGTANIHGLQLFNSDSSYRITANFSGNIGRIYNTTSDGSSNGVLYIGSTGGSALNISSTFNVGVGTPSPSYKLHVAGDTAVNRLKITDAAEVKHIEFSRAGYNYLSAPSGGIIAFVVNGQSASVANCDLIVNNGSIYAGTTNATSCGTSSLRWSNVYSVLGNFSGAVTMGSSLGVSGTLTAANGILTDYTAGSWISMATRTNLIYSSTNNSASSAHALYRVKDSSGNAICFGGLGGEVGFNGFLASNISSGANTRTWYTTWEVGTGKLIHSGGVMRIINNTSPTTSSTSAALQIENGGLYVKKVIRADEGIWTNGYLSAKGQNTTSDMRLKDVLSNIDLPVKQIAQAPAFKFKWKDSKGIDDGSSAQYWETVLPECVREIGGYKTMAYANIALLSAISLARNFETLEQRVARLEKENKELKKKIATLVA